MGPLDAASGPKVNVLSVAVANLDKALEQLGPLTLTLLTMASALRATIIIWGIHFVVGFFEPWGEGPIIQTEGIYPKPYELGLPVIPLMVW